MKHTAVGSKNGDDIYNSRCFLHFPEEFVNIMLLHYQNTVKVEIFARSLFKSSKCLPI